MRNRTRKDFVKLFGEYLRIENVLQNYDEFTALQALQGLNSSDPSAIEEFKAKFHLTDETFTAMQAIQIPSVRTIQDCRSTYNDIRDWLRREKAGTEKKLIYCPS
jgi:type I restriction enzyme R subunit